MAKLGSYYGLCPLIDHKSLLGVCEDASPGCVVVTLGKNMAIKYKLSDQKQIHSWSTKDKLSSPVIYDKKENRYVAVFNQTSMRFWNENEQNLEKLKKIKFSLPLHTLISSDNDPIIIFKNGRIMTLSYALEIRKELPPKDILDKNTTIEDQTYLKIEDTYFVGLLVSSNNIYSFIWTTPESKSGDDTFKNMRKIELTRVGFKLNGHVVMLTEYGPVLFTLWSDGRLYSHSLDKESPEIFYSVIETLSRSQPICLLALNSTYFAMYGPDSNQEGASLQIYNIQFKVTQSKLALKLFTAGSKLWLIGSSVLLTVGQNLAVVPFHLATEQLAALVGSHKLASVQNDDVAIVTEMIQDNWDPTQAAAELPVPASIKFQLGDLLTEGWSEAAICEDIFPKLFDKRDTRTILICLDYFSDIPESILVQLLSYTLQQLTKSINIITKGFSGQYNLLLNKILKIPYSDVIILPKLRTCLKFDEVLTLLEYFCFLLSDNGHNLPEMDTIQSEKKVIDWGCLLLDAHYQKFLLSKDNKVIDSLKYFKTLTENYLLCIDDCKIIEPIISQLNRGKSSTKLINTSKLKYSLEKLKLY